MFHPDTPPPSQFHHKKTPLGKKLDEEEDQTSWVGKVFAWLFIIIGLAAIVTMVVRAPKGKHLVCANPVIGKASLTTFGTCTKE